MPARSIKRIPLKWGKDEINIVKCNISPNFQKRTVITKSVWGYVTIVLNQKFNDSTSSYYWKQTRKFYKGTRNRFHIVHTNGLNSGVFAGFRKVGYQERIPRYKGTRYRFHVLHTNGQNLGVFTGFQKIGYQEGIPRYPHSKTKFFFEALYQY